MNLGAQAGKKGKLLKLMKMTKNSSIEACSVFYEFTQSEAAEEMLPIPEPFCFSFPG